MKIGVIGIGEMGGTLARRWSGNGHHVRVANPRGPGAVTPFADGIGADAADIFGAVEGADVVLLSLPFPALAKLPGDLFNRAAQNVVIIDTGNYYPDVRDPHIAEIDAGMPERSGYRGSLAAPFSRRSTASCSTRSLHWESQKARQVGWRFPWRATMRGTNRSSWDWSMKSGSIRSMAVRCRNRGGSSLQRPLIVATMGRRRRGKGSGQRSRARRRRSATMRGGRDMAGSMPTSRPIPMPMPMSSQ